MAGNILISKISLTLCTKFETLVAPSKLFSKLLKFCIMYFITLINKMTDEEVKNLKFDFSWITLQDTYTFRSQEEKTRYPFDVLTLINNNYKNFKHVTSYQANFAVIILVMAMLVSFLHQQILKNTTKYLVTFFLSSYNNYNWVTRIWVHTIC